MSTVSRRSFLEKAGVTLGTRSRVSPSKDGGPSANGATKRLEANSVVQYGTERRVVESAYKAYADPSKDLELDVVFTDLQGNEHRVPAFWAGEQVWRVRYSPAAAGHYAYRTICSDTANGDLYGQSGWLEGSSYTGDPALRKRGLVRVDADRRHFEHGDGTPFFWLADTWWMGLCKRSRWPEDFQQLASDRVSKGFTVIQIIAALYPDMPPSDVHRANEAGFPWEANYARINPRYFDMADLRIQYLVERGLVPCVVGCRGDLLPLMGIPRMKRHWRNLIARWLVLEKNV